MKDKVLLGVSGGVDSAVCAILLQEQGYEVLGVTMKLWEVDDNNCSLSEGIKDAINLCNQLHIEHYIFDFAKEFKNHVINDFVDCYANAITPNPCIECNHYLKFGLLYKKAIELGCKYIATGHWAKKVYSEKYRQYVIQTAKSNAKDQSYVLYNISKDMIPNILFPLGDFDNKEEIRKIAEKYNLQIAKKPDSQEICFIPDNDYAKYLINKANIKTLPGNIVDVTGKVLGKHEGLIYYTVGQRRGLGISHKEPLYVIKLDKEKNQVIVGEEKDTYKDSLIAKDLNYMIDNIKNGMEVMAKIRYSAVPQKATLFIKENIVEVKFEKTQKFITPGQSVVFYDDDILLGGGKIL